MQFFLNLALCHSGHANLDPESSEVRIKAIDNVESALLHGLFKIGMNINTSKNKEENNNKVISVNFDEIQASF